LADFGELLVAGFSEDFKELFNDNFFVGNFGGLSSLFFILLGLLVVDLEDSLNFVLLVDLKDLLDLEDLVVAVDLVDLVDTTKLPLLIDNNEHVLLLGDSNDRTLCVDKVLTKS
jgi:hypothetical protein